MNFLLRHNHNLLLLFFQAIVYSGTLLFNLGIIKILYPNEMQIMVLLLAIIYGLSLMARHGWEIILIRYLPNFIKKNDFYNYNFIKKKSIFDIFKNSIILITIFFMVVYIAKNIFEIDFFFNNISNFFYVSYLIISVSVHYIFKSIIQSHKKIKMSLISEIGFMHLFSAFIVAIFFYLRVNIDIDLILKVMVASSTILNLLNYLIIQYLEKIYFYIDKNNSVIKNINYKKIIPFYFLNALANYIFEWGVFIIFLLTQSKGLSALYFSAFQSKVFVVFFFVAFLRKYSQEFSLSIKESNMIKLNQSIKSFNSNVLFFSVIVLIIFIFFNKEITTFMFKTSLLETNLMCLTFVVFEVIYALFGCPQTIGMLSQYHNLFSKINFIISILYLFAQLIFIYLFGVWGAIFTFGFFYIIKNIIGTYFVYKKFKVLTFSDFFIKIFR
mgnify:CR=1 FL=1